MYASYLLVTAMLEPRREGRRRRDERPRQWCFGVNPGGRAIAGAASGDQLAAAQKRPARRRSVPIRVRARFHRLIDRAKSTAETTKRNKIPHTVTSPVDVSIKSASCLVALFAGVLPAACSGTMALKLFLMMMQLMLMPNIHQSMYSIHMVWSFNFW